MTVTVTPEVVDGRLVVRGRTVLAGVPKDVTVDPAAGGSAFVGACSPSRSSRHVFTLGVLQGYRLVFLFRFKIWWMIPRTGKSGRDIPMETQMLLLEVKEEAAIEDESDDKDPGNTFYVLLLPVLDGAFRTSLQGTDTDELQFCVESGDPDVQTSQVHEAVFINSGENPYELLKDSIKQIPANLDWFGWCTWDAFYTEVSPKGIEEGLESLSAGGSPARFLIIDDGWQSTINEFHKEGEPLIEGTQFATRLVDIKENNKFEGNLGKFIKTIKERHGLKFVYMWHALAGYWGGVLPTSEVMKKYNPKLVHPVQSPGNMGNLQDIVMDILEKYGVGIIDPSKIYNFYNDLHSYLRDKGVDGVKVDVQNLIETLGSGYGGRVALTKQYQRALEESVARNFTDNSLICCMSHNSDYIYSSKKGAVARASEDFMPREPAMQTLHVASVSFNSLLLGEIVVPDWDMFHSKHETADFHGAARAIGGCGVYVSDKPGEHDFKILRRLVLPDGSVLRAKHAGRPTRDCLFDDPVMDGKSLLKIWNLNKFSGVIGVFNCQGSGHWPCKESAQDESSSSSKTLYITGCVSPTNVEFLEEVAGSLSRLPSKGNLEVSLNTLQCEIFVVSPIKDYDQKIQFAPLGLIDMYNSGGAIENLDSTSHSSGYEVKITARGSGRFGAYSSIKPKYCLVDAAEESFTYDSKDGLLIFNLPLVVPSKSNFRDIEIIY
ncbi:putative galactinol--sucrose galactosyltransferase 2 [Acorus calamus]|uniref:galactinol--sucrose galactosyltransferase n=1 Tax=Acorus calamus TaxID=4465 RepID=A0AAV9F0Q0_ACOCL|nr:putative galactinol--sucrose galactosyltransferase 2 [Acorus calamus]